jgi:hypothetical protein
MRLYITPRDLGRVLKLLKEHTMKYTFTNKNMTIEEANLLLRVLWGTCDDDSIHPDYREAFTKDRVNLYRHLGKDAVINLGVEFVQ